MSKAVRVRINQALLELLQKKRVMTAPGNNGRLRIGAIVDIVPDARIEPYAHIFAGADLPMAMGAFSYNYSRSDTWLSIGRYCSIATNLELMGSDHPFDWVSSSLFSYQQAAQLTGLIAYLNDINSPGFALHKFGPLPHEVAIGHDVWIGGGVTMKRGITIGTGAVVGSRSVVTKNVAPYAIVAGVPARLVRYRFQEDLVTQLLDSEWWRYGPEALQPLDVREPAQFLDRLAEKVAGGLNPLVLEPLTGEQIIATGEAVE